MSVAGGGGVSEQFRTGALMLWGAFRQDTLAGVAAVRNRSHISLLFVDASCHRQGIARALFNAVRDFCRTDPAVSRITVNSSPYAVEIYRRLGFTATDAERVTDGIRFTPDVYKRQSSDCSWENRWAYFLRAGAP